MKAFVSRGQAPEIRGTKLLKMRLFYILLLLIMLLFSMRIIAQADTVRPGKMALVTDALKPGLRQYLVCYQNPKTDRQLGFWYWLRDIKVEKQKGRAVVVIDQRWYGSDTGAYRSVYSVNATGDFAPVYHKELVRGKLNAYNWTANGITGADSVEGNAHKGFSLAFPEPNYNWNLDIETFEQLPLAEGKSFLINFYDAGLSPPGYVRYQVRGSERLTLLDGQQADCWMLATEGKDPQGGAYSEVYWISKKDHQFLKEVDHFSGMIRYKIRMPDMMPDIRTGFEH